MIEQLIINGTVYPRASHDKYKCYQREIGETITMIDGTLVTEISAVKTIIEYSYDRFSDVLMRKCLTDLRGRTDLSVKYLDPMHDELQSDMFKCIVKPSPSFAFEVGGTPMWHDISFTLESVRGVK